MKTIMLLFGFGLLSFSHLSSAWATPSTYYQCKSTTFGAVGDTRVFTARISKLSVNINGCKATFDSIYSPDPKTSRYYPNSTAACRRLNQSLGLEWIVIENKMWAGSKTGSILLEGHEILGKPAINHLTCRQIRSEI